MATIEEAAQGQLSRPSDDIIDTLTHTQQDAIETMEAAGSAAIEGAVRFQREMADFVTDRIRHDMDMQRRLLLCRSLDDLRSMQASFIQTAMSQYSSEATRLMRLGSAVLARTVDRRPE
ncbi:hypothetical protein BH23PSE1_BH23PSE1_11860 [soil metagenome]